MAATVTHSYHFNKRKEATMADDDYVIEGNINTPSMLATPEQNMRKHINSPNLMIPNKIGKPLSWYNEFDFLDGREPH